MMTTMTAVASSALACDKTLMSASLVIHDRGHGEWAVRAQQTSGGEIALGEVIVRAAGLTPGVVPHAALAMARAWSALGEAKHSAGDLDGCIACVRAGLDALGPDYAGEDVADDTGLKLMLAAERLAEGHTSDATTIMVRMLRTRLALYAEKYAAEIVR